jgi:hypothetical protein
MSALHVAVFGLNSASTLVGGLESELKQALGRRREVRGVL